jgi:polar amino acid transport system substrate-binding protein
MERVFSTYWIGMNLALPPMPRYQFIAAVALVLLILPAFVNSAGADEITMCIDHYPPYHIIPEDGGRPYGVNIAIVESVVERLGLTLVLTENTPFKRCLVYMKSGKVDIMGGLLHTPQRSESMHLLEYQSRSKRLFLVSRDSQREILSHDDLKGITIGTIMGFKYYAPFDNDVAIKKDTGKNLKVAVLKLLDGRVDAVIASDSQYLSLLHTDRNLLQKTRACTFIYNEFNPVHIGISKNSPYGMGESFHRIQETIESMYRNGDIFRAREAFYRQYYPEYETLP